MKGFDVNVNCYVCLIARFRPPYNALINRNQKFVFINMVQTHLVEEEHYHSYMCVQMNVHPHRSQRPQVIKICGCYISGSLLKTYSVIATSTSIIHPIIDFPCLIQTVRPNGVGAFHN